MYGSVGKMASKTNDRQRRPVGQSRAATAASSVTAVPVRTQIHTVVYLYLFIRYLFIFFRTALLFIILIVVVFLCIVY